MIHLNKMIQRVLKDVIRLSIELIKGSFYLANLFNQKEELINTFNNLYNPLVTSWVQKSDNQIEEKLINTDDITSYYDLLSLDDYDYDYEEEEEEEEKYLEIEFESNFYNTHLKDKSIKEMVLVLKELTIEELKELTIYNFLPYKELRDSDDEWKFEKLRSAFYSAYHPDNTNGEIERYNFTINTQYLFWPFNFED